MGGGVSGVVALRIPVGVTLRISVGVALRIAAGVTLRVALGVTVNAADHLVAIAALGVAFRISVAGIHRHGVARVIWRRASERGNSPQGQQSSQRYRQQRVEPATKQRQSYTSLAFLPLTCLSA